MSQAEHTGETVGGHGGYEEDDLITQADAMFLFRYWMSVCVRVCVYICVVCLFTSYMYMYIYEIRTHVLPNIHYRTDLLYECSIVA